MADRVVVKFVRGHSPYQAGETAGFEPRIARRLVEAGVAVYVNSPVAGQQQTLAVDETNSGDGEADLEAMTLPQLRELAARRNISLGGATRKADIIAIIRAADQQQETTSAGEDQPGTIDPEQNIIGEDDDHGATGE